MKFVHEMEKILFSPQNRVLRWNKFMEPNKSKIYDFMNLFIFLMSLLTFYSVLDDYDDKP